MSDETLHFMSIPDSELQVRSLEKREISARIAPFNVTVDTPIGLELFKPGSFAGVNPKKVVMRMEHDGRPAGRGMTLEERSDGVYMDFKISKTLAGDELLQLAADEVTPHVSVAYSYSGSKADMQTRSGRRLTAWDSVDLREVATTWKPYYQNADILQVRSGETAVSEPEAVEAVTESPEVAIGVVESAMNSMGNSLQKFSDKFAERLEKMEERSRSEFTIPAATPDKPEVTLGEWGDVVLKILSGDRIPDIQMRSVADLITSDNAGVVPPQYSSELIGVIDPARPFMASTRRLDTPASGMSLVVPVINQRPTVAEQTTEKSELSSQITKIGTKTFDMITKGGVGDISLQLLKRADRSFLDLYIQLLAEAYAIESEAEAVGALLNAIGPIGDAAAMDPESLSLGAAYMTSFDAIRRPPDTLWVSTEAVGGFIDAKATASNLPLYPGLQASATAGGGIRGTVSGLNVIHTPALDAHGSFAIVGPSNGFAWAEDGTYTLQVDVPAKAGRDVALVGMLWFAPWYPAAFTVYNVAS